MLNMVKAILRDAETKDMKSIIYLLNKLIDYEANLTDIDIIEDKVKRNEIVTRKVAQALVDPNKKALVVEKSGRIHGVFIVGKHDLKGVEAKTPVCVFYHAYSHKTGLSIYEIHNRVKEWAKEKGCKVINMVGLTKNDKMYKLCKGLGYKEKPVKILELGV